MKQTKKEKIIKYIDLEIERTKNNAEHINSVIKIKSPHRYDKVAKLVLTNIKRFIQQNIKEE